MLGFSVTCSSFKDTGLRIYTRYIKCFTEIVKFCSVIIFTSILFASAGNTLITVDLSSNRPVTQCHFLLVVGGKKLFPPQKQENNKKESFVTHCRPIHI